MGGAATTQPLLKPHSSPHTPAVRRRSNLFPEGSLVEVRTNERDFRDTYFSATVVPPVVYSPKKGSYQNPRKITVEYHDLFEEGASTRLKEQVSIQCLRPSPAFQEVVEGFEPGDEVDAFFQEGWWIGVVVRVVEGEERRYVVTFENPPDEREFGFSELRVHWDWDNGNWVRSGRQSKTGLMFDVGTKVEVSFNKENHLGVWFPGTVRQHLTNGKYLVERCIANSDQGTKTEIVDSLHLRPSSPLLKYNNFNLLEKVDAFFDFGWWSGVVKQEFENNRYLVFFKQLNVEKEFNQSELRSHVHWKDGKWFTSSQVLSITSYKDGVREFLVSENPIASVPTAPVNNSGDGKTSDLVDAAPKLQKTPHVTPLAKKRRHISDSQIACSQGQKNLKRGNALGQNPQESHDNSIQETTTGFVSSVSRNVVHTIEKQSAPVDLSSNNPSTVKRTCLENIMQRRMQRNVGGKMIFSTTAKNSSSQTRKADIMELVVKRKEPGVVGNSNTVLNVQKQIEPGTGVIIGLPCTEMLSPPGFENSRGKMARCSDKEILNIGSEEKQQLDDSKTKQIENMKLSEIVGFSKKKKRERSRKDPKESILTVTDDAPRIIPEVDAIGMETSPFPNQEKKTLNKDKAINGGSDTKDGKKSSTRKREYKVVDLSINPQENHVQKRGRRHDTVLQVQDFVGASEGNSGEVNSTSEVNVACDAPSHDSENQSLSKWVQGRHIPSASPVDVSKSPPVSAVEQPMEKGEKNQRDISVVEEVSEKHQESEVSIPTTVDKHSVVLMEPQHLPFVKKSLLWKVVEDMDVFQRIPQNAHFQPLEHIKESLREGKAIGYMVTFATVVGKIYELQFDDPKSVTDDILEALPELEMHGFNVGPVQDRVAEFIAAKEKEVNLVGDVKELNEKILERREEKDKIEEEIDVIKEEIKKLEEKLSFAESAKGKEEDEIVSLGDQLKETEGNIEKLRREFEGAASSAF